MSQYPQPGPPGEDGYGQQPPAGPNYENYEANSPPGVAPAPPQGQAAAGRKKRAYAGQAYEFGAGANAALGGQQQAGGAAPYSGYSVQQDAAGYPQGGYQQNPVAAQQNTTPMYPGQEAMGGYQPPATGYPAPGVAGVTQQFGQMDISQKPPVAAAPQQSQRAPVLNQLYPTDLSNQPFNVAELDYPPPPAILPPNVRLFHSCWLNLNLTVATDERNPFALRQLSA
jgi:protein transport protein SEC24